VRVRWAQGCEGKVGTEGCGPRGAGAGAMHCDCRGACICMCHRPLGQCMEMCRHATAIGAEHMVARLGFTLNPVRKETGKGKQKGEREQERYQERGSP